MQPFQIIGAEFSLSSSKNSAPNFIFDTPPYGNRTPYIELTLNYKTSVNLFQKQFLFLSVPIE